MHGSSDRPPRAPHNDSVAPDILLPAGAPARRLSDLRGRPVVLAFHASTWDPARADEVAGYRAAALSEHCPSIFLPNDGEAADAFGARGQSAVFVVDARGRIAWRHISGVDARDAIRGVARDAKRSIAGHANEAAVSGDNNSGWTRREFVATALGAALALAIEPSINAAGAGAGAAEALANPDAVGDVRAVTLSVNGRPITLSLEPRVTLLDALREYAGLTGTKKGCDHGQCGACTVHVNGRRVLSCLTLAVMAQDKPITTIEGLAASAGASDGALHPMQQAFIEHDGFQCGYCTSGQIMSATAVVHEPWGPADADVREAMSGNICRCGAYPGIVAAVQEVRRARGERGR